MFKQKRLIFILLSLTFPLRSFADEVWPEGLSLQDLGWVNDPKANRCGGYYLEPDLHTSNTHANLDNAKTDAVHISADRTEFRLNSPTLLIGHVKVEQPGKSIEADRAELIQDPNTHKISSIDLSGRVIVREPSKVTVGDHAHLDLTKNQGIYEGTFYRLALSLQPIILESQGQDTNQVKGLIAEGHAKDMEQNTKGHFVLKDANYSTCTPATRSWHLHAKRIDLNHDTGRGTAHSATLYVKSIPVLYTPYLNFPIDKRRTSGFLSPLYGSSSQSGISLSFPYYWNLAPNYDMTITPTWFAKRGILATTKNRFLTDRSSGDMEFGVLPDDQVFSAFKSSAQSTYAVSPPDPTGAPSELSKLANDSTTRWYAHLKDVTNFSPNLQGNIDFTHVGDDYVQQDFNVPSPMSGQLLEQGSLSYLGNYWNTNFLVQRYQTLHPVSMLPNSNQYARVPDLTFDLNYPAFTHVNYLFDAETVNFSRGLNPGEVFNSPDGEPTSGLRNNFEPGVSLPFSNRYAFLTPTAKWDFTAYNLSNQPVGYNNQLTRNLPILDIDSGLYFDRNTSIFSHDYDQTLEPRLYYLRVPYRPQYQIPDFDTAIQGFTFDQLFQENRFSSIDRIGDANQVSLALSTRFLQPDSGIQKSAFGIGRIFYANDRKVMLCGTYGCQDSQYVVNSTSSTEPASPIVAFADYSFTKNWSALGNVAWDPRFHQTTNANANLQYMPAVNHIINFGYNYVQFGDPASPPTSDPNDPKNNLNQVGASTAWPLTNTIGGIAAWDYNISHYHFQTYLYGLSYDACCYAIRMAVSRSFLDLNGNGNPQFNRQILLQLVLKGFGGVGQNNTFGGIASLVPGYQDTFNQNVY